MGKSFYDDPSFSYPKYWEKRRYEHFSELIALEKLIKKIPPYKRGHLIDVGGGFGRLTEGYINGVKSSVSLDPSKKMLDKARRNLKNQKNLKFRLGTVEKIPFEDRFFDLALMIRVSHHLEDFEKAIAEIARVLKPGGFLILEFANKNHFKARLFSLFSSQWRKKTSCLVPVEIGSKRKKIPFVNYHPHWIEKLVKKSGFRVLTKLSVSNFRFSGFKSFLPLIFLLWVENHFQSFLGKVNFGPSIFLLLEKK